MPIVKGAPISFTEIADLLTTYYPVYIDLISPDQKGCPLVLDPFAAVPPPPGTPPPFPGYMGAIFIAMICPPNMVVRPANIGSFLLLDPMSPPFVGINFQMQAGQPIFAPDTFQELESAVYPDSMGGEAAAQGDINLQIDAYRLANPSVLILGYLTSGYSDTGPPDPEFLVTAKICGKFMP